MEDFSGAIETAEKIIQLKKANSKELRYRYAFKYIAEIAVLSGNIDFARRSEKLHVLTKTEDELDNTFAFQFLVDSYLAVADRFIQMDKRSEVESALRKAEEAANSIVSDNVDNQAQKYADIVLRWTQLGNMIEADRIAQKVFGRGVRQIYLSGLLDDLVKGFLSVGNVPPAKKYYGKIGYENSIQVDNINRIGSALKTVQEAQPKDRSVAEANLKRCQRQLWSWQEVYPDTTRTMIQMEIDAWAKGAEGRIFATEYGIGKQLENLKKEGQKYFVQDAARQVVYILNDLAHQYRIEMDFKRRREK